MKMEKIEHEILVNDYIKVILSSIPKVMTPLDFKALTHKANKLFNIGEVPIVEKRKRFIKAEKETKGIDYIITADDGAKITMHLPKIMTILKFKAITWKINKLLAKHRK